MKKLHQDLKLKLGIALDPDEASSLRHDDFISKTVFPLPPSCILCGKYQSNLSDPKPEDCHCAESNQSNPTTGQSDQHQDYDRFKGLDELPSEEDEKDAGDDASSQTYDPALAALLEKSSQDLIAKHLQARDGNKDMMTEELEEIEEMSKELKEQVPPLLQELTELRAKRDEEIEVQGVSIDCDGLFKRLLLFASLQKPYIKSFSFGLSDAEEARQILSNRLLQEMSTLMKSLIKNEKYRRSIFTEILQKFIESNELSVDPNFFEGALDDQTSMLKSPQLRLVKNNIL